MKSLKYNLAIALSLLSMFGPGVVIAIALIWKPEMNKWLYSLGVSIKNPAIKMVIPICVVLLFIGVALQGPLREFRVKTRREVEYDEYGLSKSKGHYEYLSKAERDAIDLQKTADMERLVNTTALKKMTKKGPEDPMKELDEMIGLEPVKQTIKEMVARMEFESEENKKRKKKDRVDMALSGRHFCYTGSPGSGKAQPLYSKVLTPSGFVRMGDIKVGDVVITANGDYAPVLGVFPQGKKKIYEITLNDGAKCRCSDEHLWRVQTRNDRLLNEYRIIETKDMVDNVYCKDDHGRINYSIQVPKNIDMNERQLEIHPYLLGALLGDGCLSIKKGQGVQFANKDEEILTKVQSLLPRGLILKKSGKSDGRCEYRIIKENKSAESVAARESFLGELRKLGLAGTYSHNKFIPQEYLYASYNQRLELLRGLLDTDGSITQKGEIRYGTASIALANDVIELVRSFGGNATFNIKKCSYKTKDGTIINCKDSYNIGISFPDNNIIPFFVSRKRERITPLRFKHKFIHSIKYVGEEDCQCIYIDHPSHLYITDDYIVTHNTTVARIMTSFLYKYGYIKENKCIEIDGNFLKAGTESAIKTELVLRHAYGGVLFIDEAYSLMDSSDNSGEQVIATLIKQMEDQRGRFILIIAGYTNEMKRLIDANPGFESRIKEYLHFPDYNAVEMREIFCFMARKHNFAVDANALDHYDAIIARERKSRSFGNGRTARNVLDKVIDKHTLNLATGILCADDRYRLCSQDFQNIKLGGIGFEKSW